VAVSEAVPAVVKVTDCMAVPLVSVSVPIVLEPLKNVTVPVAAVGVTVAVNVIAVPTVGDSVDAERVVVLAVVPVEPPFGACQKSPQPVAMPMANGTARSASTISEVAENCSAGLQTGCPEGLLARRDFV